jgi:hypothetical protein
MREVGGLGFEAGTAHRCERRARTTRDHTVRGAITAMGGRQSLTSPRSRSRSTSSSNSATGKPHVSSRAELSARFLIPEGSGDRCKRRRQGRADRALVGARRSRHYPRRIAGARGRARDDAELPRVLTDVPRTDNLHAMKRILLGLERRSAPGRSSSRPACERPHPA